MSPEAAEKNVHELFDYIKRWKILKGESFLLTCQRIERKGQHLGKEGLKNLFNRVMEPMVLTEQDVKRFADSLLLAYEQPKEPGKIDYLLLYDQFLTYANSRTVE
jgi:hypothetical protein